MPRRPPTHVAVVTGGTAGVGRAIARELASTGAAVAVIARDTDRLQSTRDELLRRGVRAMAVSADVADAQAVDDAADAIETELGPIDCWVNNAMASVFARAAEIDPREYLRVTEVTYLGVVHGTLAALRVMRPRNRGVIIQIGSALAYRGIPLQAPYCAAKHAVVGFTESVRTELLHDDSAVRVSMVHLPAMNTPQFQWVLSRLDHRAQPVPPIYQPEVAARAVAWIAARRRRSLLVGFPTFKAVWGNRLAPGLADRILATTGFDDQQTSETASPDRPGNLCAPVPGNFAAHGRFSDRARKWSPWTAIAMHPWVAAGACLAVFAVIATISIALARAM